MSKYGKWIGGALGWAIGGPIGGVLGFAFGTMLDDDSFKGKTQRGGTAQDYRKRFQQYRHHTSAADFAGAFVVLSAAVMKADGHLMKSELEYIRKFLIRQFGEAKGAEQVGVLKEVLKKDIPLKDVCEQIKYFMEHPMRLQLLHYLFGIAKADGTVHSSEVDVIHKIANYLGISSKDYESIRAMFYKDPSSAYKILEITPSVTDTEVKKAFRRMANKYHPDKVRSLGEDHAKSSKEMFIKVQEAYETIKKERGMK
jgi:DnaJ like chaperone protein